MVSFLKKKENAASFFFKLKCVETRGSHDPV